MKTKGVMLLIASVLFIYSGLKSSGQEPSAASRQTLHSISPHFVYSEMLVYLQDGSSFSGLLAAVEPDVLIVRKDGQDIRVSRQVLRRIILKTDTNLNRNMLYGMAAGLYAGNLFLLRDTSQPFAFVGHEEQFDDWVRSTYQPIFAACGIGLGYLATLLETGEKVFDFSSSKERQAVTWDKFRAYTTGLPQPARIHFSIHGGFVFPGFSSHYDDLLGGAGYWSYNSPSRFNLLRRAQVTYSLTPALELGLAYVCASEPSSYYNFSSADGGTSLYLSIEPEYTQHGYYLVGAFRPAIGPTAAANIGLGAGVARASLAFSGYLDLEEYVLLPQGYWTWMTTESVRLDYEDTKTFFSGFAFAEVTVRVYQNLYLGLSGEYLLKHSVDVPAFQDFRIPARKVRLGNAGIELTMGCHF